ncbi:MAG: AAA family ATPase [Myxococcales bacterium]|nr:AAA family ATPase [Myxococcales bacterium]
MIVEAQLTNFRCLEDVKVKLTPLHAIVGPNDSGKSSFLYAVNETFNKSRTVQGCVLQFFDDKVPDSARGVLLKLQAGRLQQLNAPTSGRRDVGFQSREGDGLAAIYNAIAGRAPEALVNLKDKVRARAEPSAAPSPAIGSVLSRQNRSEWIATPTFESSINRRSA